MFRKMSKNSNSNFCHWGTGVLRVIWWVVVVVVVGVGGGGGVYCLGIFPT